ncbi:MAG: hypothetical protein HY587_07535 [Candidatus Omnitrophica bacterium]|nr:hypothetical protein [Candidatus Omnitrophota bacterium]
MIPNLRTRSMSVLHTNDQKYTVIVESDVPLTPEEIETIKSDYASLASRKTGHEGFVERLAELQSKLPKTLEDRVEILELKAKT